MARGTKIKKATPVRRALYNGNLCGAVLCGRNSEFPKVTFRTDKNVTISAINVNRLEFRDCRFGNRLHGGNA